MKSLNRQIITLLAGFLFVTVISSDPFVHDHFEDMHSIVECEYCENKTLYTAEAKAKKTTARLIETLSDRFEKDFFSPYFYNFKSRAPPKNLNF